MASFNHSYTLYYKGRGAAGFLKRVYEAGLEYTALNLEMGKSKKPPFIEVYNEQDEFEYYHDFIPLIEAFPDIDFFFDLREQKNSMDNSVRYGYAIFRNGKCVKEDNETFDVSDYDDEEELSENYDEQDKRLRNRAKKLVESPFQLWKDGIVTGIAKTESATSVLQAAPVNNEALSHEQLVWLKKIKDTPYTSYLSKAETFSTVPKELITKDFCIAALEISYVVLQSIPDSLKTEDVCLAAIQMKGDARGDALQFIPDARKTEAICLEAVKKTGTALKYVPEALLNEAICRAAKKQARDVLNYIPKEMRAKVEALLKKGK